MSPDDEALARGTRPCSGALRSPKCVWASGDGCPSSIGRLASPHTSSYPSASKNRQPGEGPGREWPFWARLDEVLDIEWDEEVGADESFSPAQIYHPGVPPSGGWRRPWSPSSSRRPLEGMLHFALVHLVHRSSKVGCPYSGDTSPYAAWSSEERADGYGHRTGGSRTFETSWLTRTARTSQPAPSASIR